MKLESTNVINLDLTCKNQEFYLDDKIVNKEDIYATTCTRIMEPLIQREEASDCSQGIGADGRTDDLDSIVLVRVGWNFGNGFQEQAS